MKIQGKVWVGVLLIVVALVVMIAGSFNRTMQYYLTVDEMYQSRELIRGKEFRLSGTVVVGSLKPTMGAEPVYDFVIANAGKTVQVIYRGFAPDTFKDGSDVVVRGRWDEEKNLFHANHLLAKCASKYEAKLDHRPAVIP